MPLRARRHGPPDRVGETTCYAPSFRRAPDAAKADSMRTPARQTVKEPGHSPIVQNDVRGIASETKRSAISPPSPRS